MPIKLLASEQTSREKLNSLRNTIKDGEGLTMEEVAQAIGRSLPQASNLCRGLVVKTIKPPRNNAINVLVNPKTLKLYARQTQA